MSNLSAFHTDFHQYDVYVCTAPHCRGAGRPFGGSGESKTRKCNDCGTKLTALPPGQRGGWRTIHGLYCCPRDGTHFACRGAQEGAAATCPQCGQSVPQYIVAPEQIRQAWCMHGIECVCAIDAVASLYTEEFTSLWHAYTAQLERDLGDDVAGAVAGHRLLLHATPIVLQPAECSALVAYINRHFDTLEPGSAVQAQALDCVARALQHIDAVGMANPPPSSRMCGFCPASAPIGRVGRRVCRTADDAAMHVFWCCADCVADGQPDRHRTCRACYTAHNDTPPAADGPTPITLGSWIAHAKARVAPPTD